MARTDIVDYNFKCINPTDYKLRLTFHAEHKLLLHIFNKARTKIARTKQINVKGDPQVIQQFYVEPKYHKFLMVIIRKQIKELINRFKEKGIVILSTVVENAQFVRNKENNWDIHINIIGLYADKR